MGSTGHSVVLIINSFACFYTLIEHKQGSKFVFHFIADFNVMHQELVRAKHSHTNLSCILICTVNMDICHICVIFCAVQLFSSNVALIICYQYHIKIEKRSEKPI